MTNHFSDSFTSSFLHLIHFYQSYAHAQYLEGGDAEATFLLLQLA